MKYIVKVDIGSKQKYIYSSNRLKEIIGASEIIRFVTEDLGIKVLECMDLYEEEQYGELKNGNYQETSGHILFGAGGNAMYIFDNIEQAKKFNSIFSKFAIKNFDGLELIIAMVEFDMVKDNILSLNDLIEKEITKKKGKRKYQIRRLGYGLTRICPSTKKPAGYKVGFLGVNQEKDKIISKECNDKLSFYNFMYNENIKVKYEIEDTNQFNYEGYKYRTSKQEINRKTLKSINDKFETEMVTNEGEIFKLTDELDYIAGRKNDGSYIGVVCIDGNGMGKKIEAFNQGYSHKNKYNNLEYIVEFRELTMNIDKMYKEAFTDILKELCENYNSYCIKIGYGIKERILPIRPLIIAGDDITFITNGKMAIDITRRFTEEISSKFLEFGSKSYNLTISAGIAVVGASYPFFRAVKLASQLEHSSKEKLKLVKTSIGKLQMYGEEHSIQDNIEDKFDASFIDWEICRGDVLDSIKENRKNNTIGKPYIIKINDNNKNIKQINKIIENIFNKAIKLNGSEKDDFDLIKENLYNMYQYDIEQFMKVMRIMKKTQSKSNFKDYFRSMNSSEGGSELFAIKYNIKGKLNKGIAIKRDLDNELLYDVIDSIDLYETIKAGEVGD